VEVAFDFPVLHFPKEFLFGSAVASFQVENPDPTRNTDWDSFIKNNPDKHIINPGESGPDWWNIHRAKADIETMQSLGLRSFRMSLEWARIEPQPGVFNAGALLAYKELAAFAKEKGMTPLITLNHFTLPEWIAEKGSWSNDEIVPRFERYVQFVLTLMPDTTTWITLNEPNALVLSAYFTKYFPPGKGNILDAWKARKNMIEAHKRAYSLIKRHNSLSQIGLAYALMWYRPQSDSDIFERAYTYTVNYLNATNWIVATNSTSDFIGCNYYSGYYLDLNPLKFKLTSRKDSAGIPETLLLGQTKRPGAYTTDMGWPIVPDFFLSLLRNLYSSYKKPILITENGIADVHDRYRAFYLLTHLVALWKALDEKIPILGYNYWSTIDNLEWLLGYTRHFGLIGYNAQTRERSLRKSSGLYRDIAHNHTIRINKLLAEFVPAAQHKEAIDLIQELLNAGEHNPRVHYQKMPEKLPEKQKSFIH